MSKWLSNQLEPSRLRATIVAALALAASLGLIATAGMPAWVDGVLAVFAVLWPTVQHMLVRPVVTPVAKIEAALLAAPPATIADTTWDTLRGQLVTGTVPVKVPVE